MRWSSFILAGLVIAAGVRADDSDVDFLAGLRARRMFDVAEARGLREWQRNDLSDRERAELAIQLVLVYTDHALASPPDQRDALWAKAAGVCAALAGGWPDNPRRPLVEAQRALAELARGEQLRDEAEDTPEQAAGYAQAAEHIRAAVRGLNDVAAATHKRLVELRLHPPARPDPDALTASELESFEANLAYQLARGQRQLGLVYPPGSADRDDALLQALGQLEPIAERTAADELVWQARLEMLACLRQLGRFNVAGQRLAAWTAAAPPPDIAAQLTAKRVRLLVAEGRPREALRVADGTLRSHGVAGVERSEPPVGGAGGSPAARPQPPSGSTTAGGELALTRLEALLAARQAGRPIGTLAGGDRPWENEINAIGQLYGAYWQRRATLLVSRKTSGAAIGGGLVSGPLAAAAKLYHEGKTTAAVAAYDRAAAEQNRAGQTDQAVEAALAAAAITRAAGDLAGAATRYRTLAANHADHPRAPEAHRLAILCVAGQMREASPADRPQLVAAYEALLREHLAHWPEAATTDDVRWWLGRLLAARHDWSAAVDVLQSIPPSHAHFAAAARLVANCYRQELRTVDRRDGQRRAALLTAATGYLQPIVTGSGNRWPADWSDLQLATAASLARLHLECGDGPSDYAERMIEAAMRGAGTVADGAAWQRSARPLLVAALARSGKVAEARAALAPLASAPPAELVEVVDQLDEQLAHAAADQRPDLGRLMLEATRRLAARRGQLDAETLARLDRQQAAALAAAGDRDAALAQFRALAAGRPDDGQLHEDYAALLAEGDSADALREALAAWQQIEQHSRRGGPRWIRARQARIELLDRLGEQQEAAKLLRLTRLLYPDWDRRGP